VQQRRLTRALRRRPCSPFLALAAAAGTWEVDSIAVWVPVITTLTAAVIAHAAAERYEYLWVEYLRTATELERLRDRRARGGETDDEAFIKACEHVISVQNEGRMAKLTSAGDATGRNRRARKGLRPSEGARSA
jgi:SMODS and SLOG-associating 2TM effector domain 1